MTTQRVPTGYHQALFRHPITLLMTSLLLLGLMHMVITIPLISTANVNETTPQSHLNLPRIEPNAPPAFTDPNEPSAIRFSFSFPNPAPLSTTPIVFTLQSDIVLQPNTNLGFQYQDEMTTTSYFGADALDIDSPLQDNLVVSNAVYCHNEYHQHVATLHDTTLSNKRLIQFKTVQLIPGGYMIRCLARFALVTSNNVDPDGGDDGGDDNTPDQTTQNTSHNHSTPSQTSSVLPQQQTKGYTLLPRILNIADMSVSTQFVLAPTSPLPIITPLSPLPHFSARMLRHTRQIAPLEFYSSIEFKYVVPQEDPKPKKMVAREMSSTSSRSDTARRSMIETVASVSTSVPKTNTNQRPRSHADDFTPLPPNLFIPIRIHWVTKPAGVEPDDADFHPIPFNLEKHLYHFFSGDPQALFTHHCGPLVRLYSPLFPSQHKQPKLFFVTGAFEDTHQHTTITCSVPFNKNIVLLDQFLLQTARSLSYLVYGDQLHLMLEIEGITKLTLTHQAMTYNPTEFRYLHTVPAIYSPVVPDPTPDPTPDPDPAEVAGTGDSTAKLFPPDSNNNNKNNVSIKDDPPLQYQAQHTIRSFMTNQQTLFSINHVEGIDMNDIFKLRLTCFYTNDPYLTKPSEWKNGQGDGDEEHDVQSRAGFVNRDNMIPLNWTQFTSKFIAPIVITNNYVEIICTIDLPNYHEPMVLYYELGRVGGTMPMAQPLEYQPRSAYWRSITSSVAMFSFTVEPKQLNVEWHKMVNKNQYNNTKSVLPNAPTDFFPYGFSFHDLAVIPMLVGTEIAMNHRSGFRCGVDHTSAKTIESLPTEIIPCEIGRKTTCTSLDYHVFDDHPNDSWFSRLRGFFQPDDFAEVTCVLDVSFNMPIPRRDFVDLGSLQFDLVDRFGTKHRVDKIKPPRIPYTLPNTIPMVEGQMVKMVVMSTFDISHYFPDYTQPQQNLSKLTRTIIDSLYNSLKTATATGYVNVKPEDSPFKQAQIKAEQLIVNLGREGTTTAYEGAKTPFSAFFATENRLNEFSKRDHSIELYLPAVLFTVDGVQIPIDHIPSCFVSHFGSKISASNNNENNNNNNINDDNYSLAISFSLVTIDPTPSCSFVGIAAHISNPDWAYRVSPACLGAIGSLCKNDYHCQRISLDTDTYPLTTPFIQPVCYLNRCTLPIKAMNETNFNAFAAKSAIQSQQQHLMPYHDDLQLQDTTISVVGSVINIIGSKATLYAKFLCDFDGCHKIWAPPSFAFEVKLPCEQTPRNDKEKMLELSIQAFEQTEVVVDWQKRPFLKPVWSFEEILSQDENDSRLYMLPSGSTINFDSELTKLSELHLVIKFSNLSIQPDCPPGLPIQAFFTTGLHSIVTKLPMAMPLVPDVRFTDYYWKSRGQFIIGVNGASDYDEHNQSVNRFVDKIALEVLLSDTIHEFKSMTFLRVSFIGLTQASSLLEYLFDLKCSIFDHPLLNVAPCSEAPFRPPCRDPITNAIYFQWHLEMDTFDFQQGLSVLKCGAEFSSYAHRQLAPFFQRSDFGFAIQVFDPECVEVSTIESCSRIFVASSPDNDLEVIDMVTNHEIISPTLINVNAAKGSPTYLRWIPTILPARNTLQPTQLMRHPYLTHYGYNDPLMPSSAVYTLSECYPQPFAASSNFTLSFLGTELNSDQLQVGDMIGTYSLNCHGQLLNQDFSRTELMVTIFEGELEIQRTLTTQQSASQFSIFPRNEKSFISLIPLQDHLFCVDFSLTVSLSFYSTRPAPSSSPPSTTSMLTTNQHVTLDPLSQLPYFGYTQVEHVPLVGRSHRYVPQDRTSAVFLTRGTPVLRYVDLDKERPSYFAANFTINAFNAVFIPDAISPEPVDPKNQVITQFEITSYEPGWIWGWDSGDGEEDGKGDDDDDEATPDRQSQQLKSAHCADNRLSSSSCWKTVGLNHTIDPNLDPASPRSLAIKAGLIQTGPLFDVRGSNEEDNGDDDEEKVTPDPSYTPFQSKSLRCLGFNHTPQGQRFFRINARLGERTTLVLTKVAELGPVEMEMEAAGHDGEKRDDGGVQSPRFRQPRPKTESDNPKLLAYLYNDDLDFVLSSEQSQSLSDLGWEETLSALSPDPTTQTLRDIDPTAFPLHFSFYCPGLRVQRPPLYLLNKSNWTQQTQPPLLALSSATLAKFYSITLSNPREPDNDSDSTRFWVRVLSFTFGILIGLLISCILAIFVLFKTGMLDEIAPQLADSIFVYYYNVSDLDSLIDSGSGDHNDDDDDEEEEEEEEDEGGTEMSTSLNSASRSTNHHEKSSINSSSALPLSVSSELLLASESTDSISRKRSGKGPRKSKKGKNRALDAGAAADSNDGTYIPPHSDDVLMPVTSTGSIN